VLSLEFERSLYFSRESSILFFDIDQLGEINRIHGFNAGDQVIIEIILSTKKFVSETISLQGVGAIIARVKGDTFALVMPDVSENVAYDVAHKLKEVIENLKLGIDASITCRFAVMAINQWTSEDRFLELAYEKLKLAKDYGRGVIL
jgi:two-component system cell cycle response regulator